MPTTLPRYTVTDTGPLARALDTAHILWPDVPRGTALLTKLATSGADALAQTRRARLQALNELIEISSAENVYPPGYLAELREDWPA